MEKRLKILLSILFITLFLSHGFFVYKCVVSSRTISNLEKEHETNKKVLIFTKLFVEKVLQGGTTVSFEDRLQLENSVRALNDKEIFNTWVMFTNAKNQTEVQQNFYTLFKLLLNKVNI